MDPSAKRVWLMSSRKHQALSPPKRDTRFALLSEIDRWELPIVPVSSSRGTVLYLLLDPLDKTVRYVGVSSRPFTRLQFHIEQPGNHLLRSWVAGLRAMHVEPILHIVGEVGERDWEKAERDWISFFRSKGLLYNVHHGGAFDGNGRGAPKMKPVTAAPMNYRSELAEVRLVKPGVVRKRSAGQPASQWLQGECARVSKTSNQTRQRPREVRLTRPHQDLASLTSPLGQAPLETESNTCATMLSTTIVALNKT